MTFAAPEPQELVTLREKFTTAMDRATEATTLFWPAYKRDLAELKPKAKSEGNLDGVLAIDEELKQADRMNIGKPAAYEPLKSLQANYGTLRRELAEQIIPEKKRLYEIYVAALENLQVSLTKESRLDEAIRVRGIMQTAQQEMKSVRLFVAGAQAATEPVTATSPLSAGAVRGPSFTNSLGMKFVPVPGTEILMCIHPTRRKDYEAFAPHDKSLTGWWKNSKKKDVPIGGGEDHPVISVSWEEATAFCQWLSKKEGRQYRLPSDLEWSYAVGIAERESKGGTPQSKDNKIGGEYPWGNQWPPPPGAGNFADDSNKASFPQDNTIEGYNDGFPTTSPVMSFAPNKLGIYDMAGNVWQICNDWYNDDHKEHVMRGGSWSDNNSGNFLSSRRAHLETGGRRNFTGFRCVVVAGPGVPMN